SVRRNSAIAVPMTTTAMNILTLRLRASHTAARVEANTKMTRISTFATDPPDDVPAGWYEYPLWATIGALTFVMKSAKTWITTMNASVFRVPIAPAGCSSASPFRGGWGGTSVLSPAGPPWGVKL